MSQARDRVRPLTVQQRAMLEFVGGRVDDHYLNLEAFLLHGPLDLTALREALLTLLERHEGLRSVFPGGENVYRVLDLSADLLDGLLHVDDSVTGVDAAVAVGTKWAGAPMVLDEQLCLRVWVGRIDDAETVLVIGGHYLVFDAWSFMLFYEDLAAEYERARSGAPARPMPPQYGDLREGSDDGRTEGWSDLLDRPYRALRQLYHRAPAPLGPCVVIDRPWQRVDGSIALAAKAHRVTPYVLGVAAMVRALSDVVGDPEVVIGSPFGGRMSAEAAEAIGFVSTTLFVGADLSEVEDDAALVRHLNGQLRQWYTGPRTQWQAVLDRYGAADVYAAKFVFLQQRVASPRLVLPGLSVERLPPPPGAAIRRAVELTAAYSRGGTEAGLKYRSDVVDDATANALLDRFRSRLSQICTV